MGYCGYYNKNFSILQEKYFNALKWFSYKVTKHLCNAVMDQIQYGI